MVEVEKCLIPDDIYFRKREATLEARRKLIA